MATIDDFGGIDQPLNAPALGGPTGWAAAVRDYIKSTQNDLDTLEAEHDGTQADLDAAEAEIDSITTSMLGSTGVLTPYTGWADLASVFLGLHVTRLGPLVVIDCVMKPTANFAFAAGQPANIATVPDGFRTAGHDIIASGHASISGNTTLQACRLTCYSANGIIAASFPTAQTMLAASGWIAINIAYRGQ